MDSAKNLHRKFVKLGREKNKIQYQLLQILPEIFASEIYRKYCRTIQGYAWRFAQIPSSVVDKTLRLEKYLEDKPCLKAAVAEVGVHKVALVASIATAETDKVFADKVRNMSKPAVQELVKELRGNLTTFAPKLCCAVPATMKIELDSEMTFLFLQLKKKYGGNNQEVMMKILRKAAGSSSVKDATEKHPKREQVPAKKVHIYETGKVEISSVNKGKSSVTKLSPGTTFHEAHQVNSARAFIRYIRKSIRQKALKESNHRCAYPGCNRPPDANHHPERFSETGTHLNIKPMCRQHHEFAHNGLIENETEPPQKWKLNLNGKLNKTDRLYQKYRQRAFQG